MLAAMFASDLPPGDRVGQCGAVENEHESEYEWRQRVRDRLFRTPYPPFKESSMAPPIYGFIQSATTPFVENDPFRPDSEERKKEKIAIIGSAW